MGTAHAVHREARRVLDHQIDLLNDVDDKAARTVRITALLVGAIVGVSSFDGVTGVSLADEYVAWGTVYLVATIALGMKAYNVSNPYIGPDPGDLRRLLHDADDEDDMRRLLVEDGFAVWIERMEFLNRVNGWYLDLAQLSLAVGVFLFAGAVTARIAGPVPAVLTTFDSPFVLGFPLLVVTLGATGTLVYSLSSGAASLIPEDD